jgi:hypothetical protein
MMIFKTEMSREPAMQKCRGINGHSQKFPHKTKGDGKGLQTLATSSFHPLFEFCLKGSYAKKY